MPDKLSLVVAQQMICGCGSFDEAEKTEEAFYRTAPDCYQIHGHRNPKMLPVKVNERIFNLEGKVEYGGFLRCVQTDGEDIHIAEVKNEVFRPMEKETLRTDEAVSEENLVSVLRASKYIQEKAYGNFSSFNFTDEAFHNRVWNGLTVRARGLYLDTAKKRIAARAYEKFWNIDERPETRLDTLWQKLTFPVTAYVKENGFLGIVSYDAYRDDLLIACKSTLDSKFVQWFRELLYGKLSEGQMEKLKAFVRKNAVSLVFECIDVNRDLHIIEYPESRVALLDIVYNKPEFEKYDYERLCRTAEHLGLTPKEKAYEFMCWQDFYDWYFTVWKEDYRYNGRCIEGFVLEDDNGYMVKLKTAYYNFWKRMRGMADFPFKIIYFPVKSDGIGKYYKENYKLVLVRENLQFRRSYWYGIKPRLDKKHWKGKFVFQYDSQKLCDFYHKKIENVWGREGEEKRDWEVYTEEILGDTMFMVMPRNDCYQYHCDLVDAIKDVGKEGEVGWLAGYVLSRGWIEEMEKENRK